MSYGSQLQEINFTPYSLICLSGRNGHGKSALLDAITWAVWGQARKTNGNTKPDQGLLRLGTDNMVVVFEFEFNGNRYRIRREVSFSYGKSYALLDFGMFDVNNSLISLTEKTIRMTQDKIESMIGLDYTAYINSAFLRQGHSNEFSKKNPRERKEILGSVLGLDKFETLKKKAIDKGKSLQSDKRSLVRLFEHMESKMERVDQLKQEQVALAQQFTIVNQREKDISAQQTELEKIEKQLNDQEQAKAVIAAKLEQCVKQESIQMEQLDTLRTEWKKVHRVRLEAKDYEALQKAKQALTQKLVMLQEKQRKQLKLKEELLQRKESIQQLTHTLQKTFQDQEHKQQAIINQMELEVENNRVRLNEIDKKKSTHEQLIVQEDKQIKKLQELILAASKKLSTKDAFQQLFDKKRDCYQRFITMYNTFHREMQELKHKQSFSHDAENPSCPLCEQNLSASRKRFLKSKLEKRFSWLTHRLARLKKLVETTKKELIQEHPELQRLLELEKKDAIDQMRFKEHQVVLQKTQEEFQQLAATVKLMTVALKDKEGLLLGSKTKLKELQTRNVLDNDVEYKKQNDLFLKLEKEFQQLRYDPQEYQQVVVDLKKLEDSLEKVENIDSYIAMQANRVATIKQVIQLIKSIRKERLSLQDKHDAFAQLEQDRKAYQVKKTTFAAYQKEVAQEKEKVVQEQGRLDSDKKLLEQTEKELKKNKIEIDKVDLQIDEYKAITQALSKDGIQALLIEDAIPEIEHEANELLARLTDNRSQIFIESLRDLKDGGTKETLDIKISDSAGLRPYEMFSGGEAFRIDFALRIAISKLLARRAGTSLQTLIVDEGFGSQDEEGLVNIMDALHKIQDDFAKIIIVSHLSSLKEQFPVHFVIDKQSTGSKVIIRENG